MKSLIPSRRRVSTHELTAFENRHPYLDMFSSHQHLPSFDRGSRTVPPTVKTPIYVSDLSHTGITTIFDEKKGNVVQPDGMISYEYKTNIRQTLKTAPCAPYYADERDVRRIEREKRMNENIQLGTETNSVVTFKSGHPPKTNNPRKVFDILIEDTFDVSASPQRPGSQNYSGRK